MPEDDKRASIAKDVCLRFLNMTAKTPELHLGHGTQSMMVASQSSSAPFISGRRSL